MVGVIALWLDAALVGALLLLAGALRMIGDRWETWKMVGQQMRDQSPEPGAVELLRGDHSVVPGSSPEPDCRGDGES
jgi:hypothetical protein